MKRLLILLAIMLPMVYSCNNSEVEKLKEENTKLQSELTKRDATVDDMFKSFDNIEANLAEIRAKQMVVGQATGNGTSEVKPDVREQITNDIQMINDLLEKNKQTISNLRSQLKKSKMKIKHFEDVIAKLEKQIAEKDAEIIELKDKLEKLNFTVTELNAKVETITQESNQKTEVISQQTEELNSAWYVIGTAKELQAKNVITREGGVVGIGKSSKLSKEMNTEYFTKIDIRKVTEITIAAKKAKVLSNHPQSSFELKLNGKSIDRILVKDYKRFWSISKYLVVEVE
jgi:predicted  nucleic acid-binding Zn-ribbon protein